MNLLEINDIAEIVTAPDVVRDLREQILDGSIVIKRAAIDAELVASILSYLVGIGKHSLPMYSPIEVGHPNFHRLNRSDERSYVEGCFHQFVFYPWNQDLFDLFALTNDLFRLKSALSGKSPDYYLGKNGRDGIVSRLAFQFYPSGSGYLNRHKDPVGQHQITIPLVLLSEKGKDFSTGGLFAEDLEGVRHDLDELVSPGDAVFLDASLVHGVDLIDEGEPTDWLAFRGRWSLIVSTNKVASETAVADAVDLGRP